MKQYTVELLHEASEQFLLIQKYIKYVLCNIKAAKDFKQEIHEKFDMLETEPHIYGYAPYSEKYRKIPIKNYIALYFIEEETKTVYITAIVYSGSDYTQYIND